MITGHARVRVVVYNLPVDMRKSFQGLRALTKNVLNEDPLSGHWFVFINKRGNYLKLLYWDRGGFCLWCKRLEQGLFARDKDHEKTIMDTMRLHLLIEGIAISDVKQRKRFILKKEEVTASDRV